MNKQTPIETVMRCRSLDEAFSRIVDVYSEKLYWHCRRIVVSHDDAEDALQNALITAFENASSFRGESAPVLQAWLYRIATTASLKVLRKYRRSVFSSLDDVSPMLLSEFEEQIAPDADEISVRLQRAVLNLPTKQRITFNMRYFDELPYEEISQITGMNVGTLKTNYHYAVEKIKKDVQQIDLEE